MRAGRPRSQGFPVAIPFTSQGLYSTVADATGGWGSPMIRGLKPIVGEPTIRGLKPTAKFICRYAAKIRYPKIRIVVCGQSRHRRVEILPRRVATADFCRGFQPTDHVAPIGSRRVATDECHPSGIHAGGTPALPGFPVAIPFTSQGLYSTVADATGGWGSPMIRGLKPTAKINRRYATVGFQPGGVVGWSRDDSSVAMRR